MSKGQVLKEKIDHENGKGRKHEKEKIHLLGGDGDCFGIGIGIVWVLD